eukprot:365669-Chlamydomonas_euryale.AAC.4
MDGWMGGGACNDVCAEHDRYTDSKPYCAQQVCVLGGGAHVGRPGCAHTGRPAACTRSRCEGDASAYGSASQRAHAAGALRRDRGTWHPNSAAVIVRCLTRKRATTHACIRACVLFRAAHLSLFAPGNGQLQTPGNGQLQTPGNGQLQTPGSGLRPPGCGLQPPGCGLRPLGCGLRPPGCGLRPPGCGLRPPAS